ncbi:MAG: glycosyltransferase family 4 protein [Verrucomicrobiales bacterium]
MAHILRKYNPAEWGGTETAVKQLLDGLVAQGVRGTVFAPRLKSECSHDPLKAAGHEVRRYRAFAPVLNISPEQRAQLISIGGNLMSLDLLPSLMASRNADVIHTHTLNRIGGIALTTAKVRKKPLVVTIHGGVFDLPKSVQQNLAAPLEGGFEWGKIFGVLFRSRHVLKDADAVVTCNPREAALMQEKFPKKRVMVQPHGVPITKYAQDQRSICLNKFPTLQNKKVLLVVGRIDPVKNQGWLLIHFPEIVKKYPDAMLVFAGACTDELYGKALRKEVKRLGLEHKVLFTGGLPPGDPSLIGLVQQASVVVVPSLSETFGLIILEAWAGKAPVISSRTSGALSIVRDGENGILIDLERPEELLAAVSTMLGDPKKAAAMAQAGHELAANEFDTLVLSTRVKKLYEELIQEKQKR